MSETKRKLATLDANGNLVPFRYGGKYPERLHDKVVVCATFDAEGNEIPLPFFGGQEGGTIPENIQYLAEVSENTALRHDHPHMETINAFSEESGGLLWNGEPVGTKAEVYDSYFDLPETAEIGTQALVKVYEDERMSDVEYTHTYDKLYLKPTINLEKLERMLESNKVGFEILIGEDRKIFWAGDKSFPYFPPKTLMLVNENGLPIYLLFAEPIPKGIIEDVFTLQGIPLENLTIPTPVLFGWYSVDFGFINDNVAIALTRGEPYVFEDGGYVSIYGDFGYGKELFIKYVLNSEPWDDYQGRFMGYWNMVYSDIGWVKI